ncbi:MAG: glycogen synthase GlgA [Syntrophobacteraceae bacterium CG07_land_8_20_14_0_80_61_8]|nr:MAG: glycogen synthase GlgA [Syntrophobacteraceae bacterium CG07_land_8_20_14_0_80_61_8]
MNLPVLFCASEAVPFAQTGGLGDVVTALTDALRGLGCDSRILLPFYRETRDRIQAASPLAENIPLQIGDRTVTGHFWETKTAAGTPVYLLEKDEFFDRSHLYGNPRRGDYEDSPERFTALSRAVHALCTSLDWAPRVLHLHDWQSALGAAYLRFFWRQEKRFAATRCLFTIHNLGYQGLFPAPAFRLTGLPWEAFTMHGLEFWGQCNLLKAGIKYADRLNTVSPKYSLEIQTPEFGFGLDQDLYARRPDLSGILNGIADDVWNPATDPHLKAPFDADHLNGKWLCKLALLKELGFGNAARGRPLLAMVGRLAAQKGLDLLLEILPDLLSRPLSMVILGSGDPALQQQLRSAATAHPEQIKVVIGFDDPLAHRIEAGADFFLMPSRYEPCGLNQMYSLRYGTLPVVHAVGGLDDSVRDLDRDPDQGTGFKFYRYASADFLAAIDAALTLYGNPTARRDLRKRAMRQDFSWQRSARRYLDLYQEMTAQTHGDK